MSKPPVVARTEPVKRYVGPVQPPTQHAAPTPPPEKSASEPAATTAETATASADTTAFVPVVYQPQDIACPHQNPDLTNCGAAAGEPCRWQQPGMDGTYHAERVADAAAASQRDGIKPTQDQFDQAAVDSGLF